MTWGYKILFVYITFVGATMFLVMKASSQKDDLVTYDYYAQELKYQQRIDETKRTNALSGDLQCVSADGKVVVVFPKDFSRKTVVGNVLLYCPSDEEKDMKQDFTLQNNSLTLNIPGNYKGSFELHISWVSEGKRYYFQKKIFI